MRARTASQQDLARDHRRNDALHEVADAVVGVALEMQQVLQPEAERHAGVAVRAAEDEHQRMDFQPPGDALEGFDAGNDERGEDRDQCGKLQTRRAI